MEKIKKGLKLLKTLQFKRLLRNLNIHLFGDFFIYLGWQRKYLNKPSFQLSNLGSIAIIIEQKNKKSLKRTLASIKKQDYPYYQIYIKDKETFDLHEIKEDYLLILKSGDQLATNALSMWMKNMGENKAIYSDHDLLGKVCYKEAKFKPNFSIDLLRSYPYIHRAVLFKKDALHCSQIKDVNLFVYEQLLLLYENKQKIGHIAHVLCHFDKEIQIDTNYEMILKQHLERLSLETKIIRETHCFEIHYLHKHQKASIIIPNKDHKDDLKKCIDSIYQYTDPNLFEIVIVENNSETSEIFDYYHELEKKKEIKVVYWQDEFNYSAINNFGVTHASYDHLLFLNNDIEILEESWLDDLLGSISREDIGIVGVKLLYPNKTIQHGGVIVGLTNFAAHMFLQQASSYEGYMYRACVKQNLSAVTAACLMTKKSVFEAVGGFEEQLKVAFNDIDFCLKVSTQGWYVLFDPDVVLIHHESLSRGSDEVSVEKKQRFDSEVAFMNQKWTDFLEKGDPFYNSNLTLDRTDYRIR